MLYHEYQETTILLLERLLFLAKPMKSKYYPSLLIFFILICSISYTQSIDTVYFEDFETDRIRSVSIANPSQFQVYESANGLYRISNTNRFDTARVVFDIPALKEDSFALVLKLANVNNEKKTWYTVYEVLDDSVVTHVNNWQYNPAYRLGFGTKENECHTSIELQSSDTSSVEPKRRLCYRIVKPGVDNSKTVWKSMSNKRTSSSTEYNIFSFVKLGERIHFFERGYRHYFKVNYSALPKQALTSFDVDSEVNSFVIDVMPGAELSIQYVLVTAPE